MLMLISLIIELRVNKLDWSYGNGNSFAGEQGETISFDPRKYWFAVLQAYQRWTQAIMAEDEERIELKFRIYDGTDIAHGAYPASTTTVGALKQKLIAEWPQG